MELFSNFALGSAFFIETVRFFFDVFVKGLFFLAAVAFLLWLVRHRSAEMRFRIAVFSLAALIIMPFLSLAMPKWGLPIFSSEILGPLSAEDPDAVGTGTQSESDAGKQETVRPQGNADSSERGPATQQSATGSSPSVFSLWPFWVAAAWAAVTALIFIWQVMGKFRVSGMIKHAEEIEDERWIAALKRVCDGGLPRKVRLLGSSEIKVPTAVGIFSPAVLIPNSALDWPEETVEAMLLHEIAHLRRRDLLTRVIAQVACVLHWFNPMVWVTANRLFTEQERATDDYVLNRGVKVSDYARHLIEASENVKRANRPSLDVAAMARGTDFKDRMLRVLDPGANRKSLSRAGSLIIALVIAALILPFSAFNFRQPVETPEIPDTKGSYIAEPEASAVDEAHEETTLDLENAPASDDKKELVKAVFEEMVSFASSIGKIAQEATEGFDDEVAEKAFQKALQKRITKLKPEAESAFFEFIKKDGEIEYLLEVMDKMAADIKGGLFEALGYLDGESKAKSIEAIKKLCFGVQEEVEKKLTDLYAMESTEIIQAKTQIYEKIKDLVYETLSELESQ